MMKSKTTNKKNFFKQVVERWKSETPKFWKKIRSASIIIGTSAVSVIGVDKMFNLQTEYNVPGIIFTIAGYIVVFCAAVGLSAQITKNNSNDLD